MTVWTASRIEEVMPRLRDIERAVEADRLHAAGWIAYEAAPAFDPALTAHPANDFPLLWFALFSEWEFIDLPLPDSPVAGPWLPDTSPEAYARAFERIKRHIHDGDTYQADYTYRLVNHAFPHDPWQAFLALAHAQDARFGAYLAADPWRIASASPELFLRLDGTRLESRPMKGTAPRGLTAAQDRAQAQALAASEKNRAENLMIVDMVRHDLGRVARPGSVHADLLCTLEKYPTVWQMVSTVTAETHAPVADILAATFPPASITGAPKARTMDILAGLESSPRQVYTGAIGFLAPGRHAQFNVAIRTLLIDLHRQRAEFGVGGGIVWNSDLDAEQAECRTKARILSTPPPPPFDLLETILWTPENGLYLLDRHLQRLRESAEYFDYSCDESAVRDRLEAAARSWPADAPRRIRLLLAHDGSLRIEDQPLAPLGRRGPLRLTLATRPIDRRDPFLYHKTTHRRVYEQAKAEFPEHDDVVLFNDHGEATETTLANLVVELDGCLCTPPVECGLLPGTARADGLARGLLQERILPVTRLREPHPLFILNSVRGLIPAVLDIDN